MDLSLVLTSEIGGADASSCSHGVRRGARLRAYSGCVDVAGGRGRPPTFPLRSRASVCGRTAPRHRRRGRVRRARARPQSGHGYLRRHGAVLRRDRHDHDRRRSRCHADPPRLPRRLERDERRRRSAGRNDRRVRRRRCGPTVRPARRARRGARTGISRPGVVPARASDCVTAGRRVRLVVHERGQPDDDDRAGVPSQLVDAVAAGARRPDVRRAAGGPGRQRRDARADRRVARPRHRRFCGGLVDGTGAGDVERPRRPGRIGPDVELGTLGRPRFDTPPSTGSRHSARSSIDARVRRRRSTACCGLRGNDQGGPRPRTRAGTGTPDPRARPAVVAAGRRAACRGDWARV